jgi:class 3 adenylate cyclase/isopentenyldiphosphate isomerase
MQMDVMGIIEAEVIFVDVRGFTTWAEKVDVFPFLDEFSSKFYEILRSVFAISIIKTLGDGAMIVTELGENPSNDDKFLQNKIKETLKSIALSEKEFNKLCTALSRRHGSPVNLVLGWGITKGWVKKIGSDYIGSEVNKSARLCGIARPRGVVIDKDDFSVIPKLPKIADIQLFEQIRKLKGIGDEVHVWVSKEIANQFITRENIRLNPEVHIAGICIREKNGNIQALIAKRSTTRKLFPGLYEGCGGQLDSNETFSTGVIRHYKLELNIEIEVVDNIHKFYYINQPNEPIIPGIKFLCIHKNGTPSSENHTEVKWATEEEVKSLPEETFIPGLKQDFLDFINHYKKSKIA